MSAPTTFYSASAGSGKTFTLARDYLTYLFRSPTFYGYRDILAVTFTNKAVAEMKERIVEYLHAFTKEKIPAGISAIAIHIKDKTGLDDKAFQDKAAKIYYRLLHDYSAFDIVTIDAFNHRILRTFSKDLKLPDGFEVELDSNKLISKAINNLIARAGSDKRLTQQLIDFSLSKINEGKSWDIEYDLADISKLILNENHYYHLKNLKDKKLDDFLLWRKSLLEAITQLQDDLVNTAIPIARLVNDAGLSNADFKGGNRSSPFKTIEKVIQGDFTVAPDSASIRDLLSGDLYAKGKAQNIKNAIDGLSETFHAFATHYNNNWGVIAFYQNISKSLTPLSLLNEILIEINRIKITDKIVPIYEFNGLLAEQIKDQPAPFIYERLGERYAHFFIDEFQDTSSMQWENMSPLIANALQQERPATDRASLMLVGDAKQSIYRWRGGDVNQFLRLLEEPQLFFLDKEVNNLEYNWRSYDEIISFNNLFFDFYGDYLQDETYKNLYKNYLKQKNKAKPGGFVRIDFLDKDLHKNLDDDQDMNTAYPTHVYQQILEAKSNGFTHGDICVLVRANKHGNEIATYLVSQGISVVSGESLLVSQSPKVELLVHFMQMVLQPFQQEPRYQFLKSYAAVRSVNDVHEFLNRHINVALDALLLNLLGERGVDVGSAFAKAPLFKATEDAALNIGLLEEIDTRLQTFLNFVFEYAMVYDVSLSGLLEQWEMVRDKLSVPSMPDDDAVQVMTIHKSKGLEFPVVIVPHCDLSIQDISRDTGWVTVDSELHQGFHEAFISIKNDLEHYPTPGPEVLESHIFQSQMDQINVLYVAFTRAREQLYISCTEKSESNGVAKGAAAMNYSQLLMRYLITAQIEENTDEGYISYCIGSPQRLSKTDASKTPEILNNYTHNVEGNSGDISTLKGMMWATDSNEALEKGNQLHYYLSFLKSRVDQEDVFIAIDRDSSLTTTDSLFLKGKITDLLNNESTATYFDPTYRAFNEQKILMPDGANLIPDRLLFREGKLTIIDYKTGIKSEKHFEQIENYTNALKTMGHTIDKRLLIYTDLMEVVTI
jgi:ATP-dependent exoDNAse (exonuclease V) beta subunit